MKLFTSLLVLLSMNYTVFSQMHVWPPEPIQKSTFEIKLSENRFIPSTSRWNLIWADQIIPGYFSEKQLEFAAKNYIGTQKLWSHQINLFREYNPNFLGLIYHLAVGLNPQHNDDCPNPKSNSGEGYIGVVSPEGYVSEWDTHFLPWLQAKNIDINSTRFERMFQHWDTLLPNYRVWHNDPYWLMDIQNTDWQDYLIEQCLDWMEGNQDEGCFFDVSVETYAYLYNPKSSNPEPTNFNWWQSPHKPENSPSIFTYPNEYAEWMNETYLKYYQKIYKAFHQNTIERLVIPNVDQMVTTVYDPVWLDGDENGETIDGAMIEGFGNYRGQDMYLTLERCIRHITGRGKILIAQFDADTPEERYRRTGMYMLVKNDNSYININPTEIGWYPEYEIDLGEQSECPNSIDSLRIEGEAWQSLWRRDYEKGLVLCNTSNKTIFIKTPDIPVNQDDGYLWYKIISSGGGKVNADGSILNQSLVEELLPISEEISIYPSECVILRKQNVGSVNELLSKGNNLTISPNPTKSTLTIQIEKNRIASDLKIYNLYGENILNIPNIESEITIDISDLPSGVYFICGIIDGRVINKKFTKVR